MTRSSYTTEWKLRAIKLAKANANRKAAKELNVDESTIRRWRKQEDELRQVKKSRKAFVETLHDGQNLKIILSTGFLKCDQLVELSLYGSKPRH